MTLVLLVQWSSPSASSTVSYRNARHLAALSVITNAIVVMASTPVTQTSVLVA